MTVPVIRKRAKKPKTHTGCITCRARHIKCDEEKPACRRCTKSRRVCEGYTAAKRQTRRNHHAFVLPKPLEESPCSSLSLVLSPASITCELSGRERGAFEYFHREAAHQLPGNSWTLSWPQLAVQMGQHEPAIAHIAIALGSLHRSQRQCYANAVRLSPQAPEREHCEFAFAQYSKAIASLRHYINDVPSRECRVEVVLLVSLLFFCFEVWNADDQRAAIHLRTGLKILREKYRDHSSSSAKTTTTTTTTAAQQVFHQQLLAPCAVPMEVQPRDEMALLLQTFVRLDSDLTIAFKGDPSLRPVLREPVPDAFMSLEEARAHLDALTTAALDTSMAMVEATRAELLQVDGSVHAGLAPAMLDCLAEATARTLDFSASHPRLAARVQATQRSVSKCLAALAFVRAKPEQEAAHLLVQIQLFVLWYSTVLWGQRDEMHADRFERQFEHILSLAERYVDLHHEDGARIGGGRCRCSRSSNGSSDSGSGSSSSSSSSSGGGGGSVTGPVSMLQPLPCTRPAISVGTGLIAGVCVIALHCRDSAIRRRCVQLLGEVNLQGIFDNQYLVSFIKTLIEVEEAPARALLNKADHEDLRSEDIPLEMRVMEISIGGRPFEDGDFFWKDDFGFLIYSLADRDGNIAVKSKEFYIDRYV